MLTRKGEEKKPWREKEKTRKKPIGKKNLGKIGKKGDVNISKWKSTESILVKNAEGAEQLTRVKRDYGESGGQGMLLSVETRKGLIARLRGGKPGWDAGWQKAAGRRGRA